MKIYVDSSSCIKDVNFNSLEDSSLIEIDIDDEDNPFKGWSNAKICCYKVGVMEVPIYPDPEPVDPDAENDGDDPEPEPTPPEPIGTKTIVTMMTPYVDSRLLYHIDQLGLQGDSNTKDIADNREGIMEVYESEEENAAEIADTREGLIEVYEGEETNSSDIADLREAVMELYEMMEE